MAKNAIIPLSESRDCSVDYVNDGSGQKRIVLKIAFPTSVGRKANFLLKVKPAFCINKMSVTFKRFVDVFCCCGPCALEIA